MRKRTFIINEIMAPVNGWQKSGFYVSCPRQWAGLDVRIVLPDGKELVDHVRATESSSGYVPIERKYMGKTVTIRPVKKITLPA